MEIGFKMKGGQKTVQLAIRVLVKEKKDVPVGQRIPKLIRGFPTDVIQREFKLHTADSTRYEILRGGSSIGPCRLGLAGTLGCIVNDNATGAPMALSNWHVLVADTDGAIGDTVTQPSTIDDGECPDDVIGTLARSSLGGSVDCAVVLLDEAVRGAVCEVMDVGAIAGQRTIGLGEIVVKRGRTSGVSTGTVDSVDLSATTDYGEGIGEITLTGQISIQPNDLYPTFGAHGDSGSVVLDANNNVVGLYYAGSDDGFGIANPIAAVLEALSVSIAATGIDEESGGLAGTIPTPLIERTHILAPRSLVTVMESRRKRVRRQHHEALEMMDVQWNFTQDQYDTFRNWFIDELDQGVKTFPLSTLELSPEPGKMLAVTRICAFINVPPYTFSRSDDLFTVFATLAIDREESIVIQDPNAPPEPPEPPSDPPVITYSPCKDEITVEFPNAPLHTGSISDSLPGIRSIEVLHSDTQHGPWLFWGETRVPTRKIVLSNYFATRWIIVNALSIEGIERIVKFKPLAPSVLPPIVKLEQYHRGDTDYGPVGACNQPLIYTGGRAAAPYRNFPFPYSLKAYSAIDAGTIPRAPLSGQSWPVGYGGESTTQNTGHLLDETARDPVSAVYEDNLTTEGVELFKVNLFSSAFVELTWRYCPELYGDDGTAVARLLRVTLTCQTAGAVLKFTVDGTDPSLTNGLSSPGIADPSQVNGHDMTVPYLIARAFKDGCQSAPVYIPIDTKIPQTGSVHAIGQGGDGTADHLCPVYIKDADCGVHGFIGDGDGSNWPCTDVDLGALRISALTQACGGLTVNDHVHTLRHIGPDGTPTFLTRPAFDFPEGPWLGDCPSSFFGGGRWVAEASMWYTIDFTYSWDSSTFTHKPVNAFYLMSGAISHNGVTGDNEKWPLPESQRDHVAGMPGATGGVDNLLVDRLVDNVPIYVFDCPSDGAIDILTDVSVTISCGRD